MESKTIPFRYGFGTRFWLFILITALSLLIGSALMIPLVGKTEASMLRMITVIQDVMVFILPAILTALVITRLPASFLCADKKISMVTFILAVGVYLASIPAMNCLVEWNKSLHLPASLSSLEEQMIAMEKAADDAIHILFGDYGIGSYIMALLIVGVLAGFSEEIFFRGTLQRLFATAPINHHLAIWLSAIIFSGIHFQFYGFFPRLMLGAFFGYLLVWSGSLWLPVIMHTLNNSMVVTTEFINRSTGSETDLSIVENVGTGSSVQSVLIVALSVVLTAILLRMLWKINLNAIKNS